MIEKIRIKAPFFYASEGTEFNLVPGTYASQVCDVCGNRRMCDWYVPKDCSVTGMDVCRTCGKTLEVKEALTP